MEPASDMRYQDGEQNGERARNWNHEIGTIKVGSSRPRTLSRIAHIAVRGTSLRPDRQSQDRPAVGRGGSIATYPTDRDAPPIPYAPGLQTGIDPATVTTR